MSAAHPTARDLGLTGCRRCGLVVRGTDAGLCPRCQSRLSSRQPNSLTRCWALLAAAAILYVPANLLPIMVTTTLFGTQRDTILSGILYFWETGSRGLAVLIFTVSILIPLLKLISLAYLTYSAAHPRGQSIHQRARLYRLVEVIGRWSMLDMFVVALMAGLVRFQNMGLIEAGPGAAPFGAVVVLTMLAALTLDPRLMWDSAEDKE
ncbi:paraquat-inducible protein A [mine drainage metagenome]|uniref:Paraquat-inducible protein A n=1 Tax=mine drainage metagenome TaxID=410659 RepID=A0A1J5R5C2_9ZZZZ